MRAVLASLQSSTMTNSVGSSSCARNSRKCSSVCERRAPPFQVGTTIDNAGVALSCGCRNRKTCLSTKAMSCVALFLSARGGYRPRLTVGLQVFQSDEQYIGQKQRARMLGTNAEASGLE